ncbi:MAG TPA: hypothetical protein G4N92_05980 [Anaerolineae bacterium]|nr:hypothetical protein [Anaerolineae bacterium]
MKNNSMKITPVLILLIISTLACNFPQLTVPTAEVEIKTEEDEAPTAISPTSIPTETIAPTIEPSPVTMVDWSNVWVVWIGSSSKKVTFDFLQQGSKLSGSAVVEGGHSYALNGTIANDWQSVNGTLESTNGTSYEFTIYLLDTLAQFNGNLNGTEPFCGARDSSAKPATCFASVVN